MDQRLFYSIRMRANAGNLHISGAERIVLREKIDEAVKSLVDRALGKNHEPEQIIINIESLDSLSLRTLTALDVITVNTPDVSTARSCAVRILQSLDISEQSVMAAIKYICDGAASTGRNMRGAMILDARNGERLEPDHERGVRASRFDWSDESRFAITKKLAAIGLTHYRTCEALALATKVAHAPGIIAEMCWSDEPDYPAGYVASLKIGYVRFPLFKTSGDSKGGRAFFVNRDNLDMNRLISYLQHEAVIISDTGECRHDRDPADYLKDIQS
jgi:6-carboxyhexanoate--CoA ligase